MRRAAMRNDGDEIKKGPWKAEEDEVLINHVRKHGARDWSSIRSKGLLQRTGKSCRLRWVNKLRPNLKNGVKFSAEEERTVIDLQAQFGNKWARIATYLSGRTDNDVKNFWSSRQKRLARILQTSASAPPPSSSSSSSSRSQKNTKEIKVPVLRDDPTFTEAPKLSSSPTEDRESATKSQSRPSSHISNPNPITMVPLPELLRYPSPLTYEHAPLQLDYNAQLEEKDTQSNLSFPPISHLQPDFPLPLESHDFISKLGDTGFLDVFDHSSGGPALGTEHLPMEPPFFESCQIDRKERSHDEVTSDSFIDDFPPIDMFDQIELLPSPSEWS